MAKKDEAKKKSTPKKTAKAKTKLRSAAVAESYGVELPERYRRFLDSGECERFDGKKLDKVPGHSKRGVEVSFASPRLASLFRESGVRTAELKKIPLALPKGLGGLCVLALDVSKPECPVEVWDEGSFVRFLPSLDALLAALDGKLEAPAHERVEKAVDDAFPLYHAEKYEKVLAVLDPAIAGLEPGGELKTDRYLAKALNLRGICLEELGRKKEAVQSFEAGMHCGTEQADYPMINFLRFHLEAGDCATVIATAAKYKVEEFGDDLGFWLGLYRGLAELRAGDEAAKKTLLAVAKRAKKDAEKTKDLVEHLEELRGEHASAGTLLEAISKK
jgi:hypothetical protein